ncbi:MAG TPA: GspE/PulE family protein [Candidatus Krumholzibacteria bacterium]|nr:GspE/PulE family protein [Candidatus Krumholzibacteria bacterium]HRX51938.1 GspE/PulE family protein [Candidatus Krumholzibacteria bacterium]
MATVRTKKMGQILVEAGVVSAEKLEMALREQRQTGEKLGTALQRLGICSEKAIAQVLAEQAGVECVDLRDFDPVQEALEKVPRDFCERKVVLPVAVTKSSLKVVMANPLDLELIDDLGRMTGLYIEVVHAPVSEIRDTLLSWFGMHEGDDADDNALIAEARAALAGGAKLDQSNSPFVRLVDQILLKGVVEGATDIHIEPEEKVLRVRYRVDGSLIQGDTLPGELLPIVVTRMKILAEMNISENRVPQDGKIVFDAGRKQVDLRVSTIPTVHGEGIVCRILDKETLLLGLPKLGMPAAMEKSFVRDIERPHGIILVTGPTGSGKTTTLYATLQHLNRPDTKIITLEDPVEYELPVINQSQIDVPKGYTFAKGLRAILRQDPDVILVGEIRDQETAQLAIRAALTGHLVFSTLHTNSAAGVVPRLVDMGIEPLLLSTSLVAVVAQRLVRRVCSACAVEDQLTAEQRDFLEITEEQAAGAKIRRGEGCPLCRITGYRGRDAVFEYLRISDTVREMVAASRGAEEIARAARADGQRNLRDDAVAKMLAGKTTVDEVMGVTA